MYIQYASSSFPVMSPVLFTDISLCVFVYCECRNNGASFMQFLEQLRSPANVNGFNIWRGYVFNNHNYRTPFVGLINCVK